MNGAEALLRTLVNSGVEVCFANPGTSEMHIMDATTRVPQLRMVPCLFEGVATGAADGYARMTRRPAATLLHLGPGLANGLANLHNACRAQAPVINIVGEHPAYHRRRETPLASDIESIARPFSHWVRTSASVAEISGDAADAADAAMAAPGHVATLAVPADVAWSEGASVAAVRTAASPRWSDFAKIEQALNLLFSDSPTALILGGAALHGPGLELAGRIAAAIGAGLLTSFPLTRLERGGDRPAVDRIPYPREQAVEMLARFRQFILIGATTPFAYFAHQDQDSTLLPEGVAECSLTLPGDDIVAALQALADAFPHTSRTSLPREMPPALSTGPLSPAGIAAVIAALLPEHAIVVDEGMTCGRSIMAACKYSAPHDWLGNTGGSIGIALPLAVGAALASPHRPILCLSADGSAMYTLQGLWTMARENLAVTTVILANNAYALLKHEYSRVAAGAPAQSVSELFDLARPTLDWVALARGMGVPGRRVKSLEEFAAALRAGFASGGPNIIEVPL
jgi:acetolactate synthase-1/2/3 large subunit